MVAAIDADPQAVLFENEASFWLDGTLHRTWSKVGVQPRMPNYVLWKTAHVFGAISLDGAVVPYRFAPVFNGHSFHEFCRQLVARHSSCEVFLVVDNDPCHWLDDEGKAWLAANPDKLELHCLPPYSTEFNLQECIWKATCKRGTHNRFFATSKERDAAHIEAFSLLQEGPEHIAAHVARFR